MLRWQKTRIARNQTAFFQHCDHGPNKPMGYHDSNIITDFRLAFCNIQTSNELHKSPQGLTCRFRKYAGLSELTSGANYEKRGKGSFGVQSKPFGRCKMVPKQKIRKNTAEELTGEMTCEVKGSVSIKSKTMEN